LRSDGCGDGFYKPDQILFRTEGCTATTNEERERAGIRDIDKRERKGVWEFVDLVSGYSHKASKLPQIATNSKTA
jgi:hypothetical protein